ncbi:disulfide bond formation protein B [Viridibacterium curvum]|uniref:Disulfide bond formation protein B n=1 Tax=Viridibacterium curvum TaxID=1101404 RepID=A0ABP9QF87_9RHOO
MNALRNLPPRLAFLAVFVGCVVLLSFGLYLQHVKGIEPCPLCILQRYGFVAAALIALLGTIFNPRNILLKIWGVLLAAAAIAGGSVSVRQIWLQHNPPEMSTCGPDLEYMVSQFPLADLLPKLFQGEGDCAKIDWTFLGFSIAEWASVCFTLIIVIALWQVFRKQAKS